MRHSFLLRRVFTVRYALNDTVCSTEECQTNPVIAPLALFRYPTNDGIFIAVIGAFAGVYLFYCGFHLLQRKRLILNTPASKIRSAAMGLVEINGLAAGPYTMIAPITGAPCYYYRTTAWQSQQQGKNSKWVRVADESLHLPFFLDDNTGRVLVDPQGAEMDIHRDFHDEFITSLFSSNLEIPPNISSFLAGHGVSTDQKIKIDEYCIKPKNALFILGTLAQNPGLSVSATPVLNVNVEHRAVAFHIPNLSGLSANTDVTTAGRTLFSAFQSEPVSPAGGYSSGPHQPATITEAAQRQKITAALMKAGITSPAAWAVAGVNPSGATRPASASSGAAAAVATAPEQFDLHPPTVLMKGTHDPAFLISWHSQRDVVRSLSWKCTLMIWGGPALTLLCAYIVAAHFDWL